MTASTGSEASGSKLWLPDARLTAAPTPRLKLLSFNMQVGLETGHYGHYLTRAWRHALPGPNLHRNLDRIAELIAPYDFVALQEADAGSLRTRFTNQMEYLAKRAGFAHYGLAVTRDLRPVAHHCMGYLSRLAPAQTQEHVLPSRIPGRRAMSVQLGTEAGALTVLLTHLSLGTADQHRQLHYLGTLLQPQTPAVLVGDLNCEPEQLRQHPTLRERGLWLPEQLPATYPSWKPSKRLDHVLLTPEIELHRIEALPYSNSDHLPLAAEISVKLPA